MFFNVKFELRRNLNIFVGSVQTLMPYGTDDDVFTPDESSETPSDNLALEHSGLLLEASGEQYIGESIILDYTGLEL